MNKNARPFIMFSLAFRILEGLVFAPFIAFVGQVLRGQVVVDSTNLVGFILSPRGFAAVLISATIFLTVRFLENAGLSVLVAGQSQGARPSAWLAFKYVMARSTAIFRATLTILISGLALLTPLALTTGFFSHRLLSQHDINYYLQAKPVEFVHAAILLGALGLITSAIALWFAIRWRWVAQVLMFESGPVLSAFRRSAKLAQPVWMSIAWRWGALGMVNFVLGVGAAWMGRVFLPLALGILGEGIRSMGFVLGVLLVLQALIGSFFTLLGAVLEAKIFTQFYLRLAGRPKDFSLKNLNSADAQKQMNWWIKAAAWILLSLFGGVLGSIWGTGALLTDRPMLVIAHRGYLHDGQENTVAAILHAIRDGADVAEIDVQLSKDGEIVVVHDSDFSRLAGVAKRVTEMTWKEIAKLDIHGTHPARLDDVLAAARDRIHLNIELKHYGPVDGRLEERVVRLLEQKANLKQIEIQSLEYESLEIVRRLNDKIPVGYLMSVNARHPEKLAVDFLSVQNSRIDSRFLRRVHNQGKKVYVWTVDDEIQMEEVWALGVDGLITNEAKNAVAFLSNWNSLSPDQKALRRLKSWLGR